MFARLRKIFRKRGTEAQVPANRERDETAKNSDLETVIAELKTVIEHLARANDQASPENQQKRALEKSGVRAVWAAAIVGLLAVIIGRVDSARQDREMRRQNEIIVTENRPWLKPRVDLISLSFGKNGDADVRFQFDYANVGKSAALNVHNTVNARVLTRETAINSIPEERGDCKESASDAAFAASGRGPLGPTLFPNDNAPEIIGGKGQISAGVSAASFKNAWPRPNDLIFKVVGCLAYSFGDAHGETGYAYLVEKKLTVSHVSGFAPTPNTTVPLDEIDFEPDGFSTGWVK
jgi:hypothetical protein